MKNFLVVLFLVMFFASVDSYAQNELKPETKIIAQPNAPVKILSYTASYFPSGSRYVEEGVHHNLEYENASAKTIVAIQMGLVSFDIWNEFLDRLGGVTMKTMSPGEKDKGRWISSRYTGFSFHTGVAYVSKVRFSDGEIWSADLNAVVLELKKIQKDFDAASLKKKEPEKP